MSNDFVFPQDGDFNDAANFAEAFRALTLGNEGIINGISIQSTNETTDSFGANSYIEDCKYDDDGDRIYGVDQGSEVVLQYDVASQYVLSGSDGTNDGAQSANEASPRSFDFNSDYSILWMGIEVDGTGELKIERHELSTPGDVSSATYVTSYNLETELGNPGGLASGYFRVVDGGDRFYIIDDQGDLFQYDLATTDDIGSRSKVTEVSLSGVSGSQMSDGGLRFDMADDGSAIITYNVGGEPELQRFSFGTNYDISTLSGGDTQTTTLGYDLESVNYADNGDFAVFSNDGNPENWGVADRYGVGDLSTDTFEVTSGLASFNDSSATAKQSSENRSEGVSYFAELGKKLYRSWDSSTTNYIYLKLNPSTNDLVDIVTKTTDSAPNSTSFKIGEISSSGSITNIDFNFDIDGRLSPRGPSETTTNPNNNVDNLSTLRDIEEFITNMSGRILNSTNEISKFNFPRTASWRAADGSYVQFSNMDSSMDFRIDRVGNNGLNYRFVDLSVTANDINDIATAITGDGQRMGQNTNWAFAANGNVMGYTGGSEIEVGEWSSESPVSGYDWQNVEGSANDVWIATGYDSANTAYTIIRSTGGFSGPDGWTEVTTPSSATSHNAIASDGNGNWVIALDGGEYIYSTDQGQTWTSNNLSTSDDLLAATYNPTISKADGDQFFIGGQSGRWVQVQTDGSLIDSNSDVIGNANNITSLACKPWNESGQLLVGDSQGNVFYTHNPYNFANFYGTGNESGTAGKIKSMTYASEDYVAIDEFNDHFHIDGDALKMRYVFSGISVDGIDANNAGLALSVGGSGRIQISADEDTSTHARIPRLIDSETAQWMVDAGA